MESVDETLRKLKRDYLAEIARIDNILAANSIPYKTSFQEVADTDYKVVKRSEPETFDVLDYSDATTIPDKILWVLRSMGSGTARTVAKKLVSIDKSFTDSKALADATNHLSKFYKSGIINASKKGNKNFYTFKEQ